MSAEDRTSRLRVGIVGVGNIGAVHAHGYARLPDAEIVAVCDLLPARTALIAGIHGVSRAYTDYREMLAAEKLDIVSVCTPNAVHAPVAVAALEAGCSVLCEKPLSVSAAEGRRIADAAARAPGKFMIGMNNRFRGDTQAVRRFVESGDLGDIYYARCGWVRRCGVPGMGSWFTRKEMSGGGPLIDIGVHALDLTLYLMGNPEPAAVFGQTYAKFGPEGRGMGPWGAPEPNGAYDVEDLAAAQVRFTNGATLVLEASWAQYCAGDRLYSEIYGTRGGATLEPLRIITERHGQPIDITPHAPEINGHEAEITHFVDCVRHNRPPLATAGEALNVMRILDAIYESARTGESVAIR